MLADHPGSAGRASPVVVLHSLVEALLIEELGVAAVGALVLRHVNLPHGRGGTNPCGSTTTVSACRYAHLIVTNDTESAGRVAGRASDR